MSLIRLRSRAEPPTPPAGTSYLYLDSADDVWKVKDDAGVVTPLPGATGPAGPTGPGVPTGGTAGQILAKINSTDYNTQWVDSFLNWADLATSWDAAPTLNKNITGGAVYNYTFNSVTRYRFVPSTYDPSQDSFYENFDNVTDTLSDLIVSRGA